MTTGAKRQFHPKKAKRVTAAQHQLAQSVASLVAAAAGKLLRDRYGWTTEDAATFIDELPAAVTEMSTTINGVFDEARATGRSR
jgi:hypothetical protein